MIQNYTTHYKLIACFHCLYNYSYLGTRQIIDIVK